MKKIANFDSIKPYTDTEKLPVGAYVVKLMKGARVETSEYGETLLIPFDIEEGDYKGFYTEQFQNSQLEDKKYKGVYRMRLPKEDGTEQDGWTMRRMKTDLTAIEDSNPGYHWNWDEASLAGKLVGIVFQEREWEFNGQQGVTAQPHSMKSAEDIRAGKFKLPPLKKLQKGALDDFSKVVSDDGDLPF